MSKKDDKKKKTLSPLQVKQLEDLANLTKAYKAICKRLGVSTYGPFLQDLAACTETIQPLSKVVCQGSSVDHAMVECMLEVLQGYAACRGLAFMGCSLDDEALCTVTGLLLKGCAKWWAGPKLQLLEITAQHHEQQDTGKLPSANKLSTQLQSSIAAQDIATAQFAPVSVAAPSSTSDSALQPVQALEPGAQADTSQAALDNSMPALDFGHPQLPPAVNSTAPLPEAVAQRKPLKAPPPLSAPLLPLVATRQHLQQSRSTSECSALRCMQPGELPVTYAVSTLVQPGPLFIKSFPEASLDSSTTLPQNSSIPRHSTASTSGGSSDGDLWKVTTWGRATAQKVSKEALSGLAAALGSPGIQLTVLTLGHVDLGDAGMQLLCRGLCRCSTLQKLLLPCCGIGAQGIAPLAEAITPIQPLPGKPVLQPKLTHLDLQGNPFGGEGLSRLCSGLAACVSLVDLNLRAVGITEQHQDAVRQFANMASCHPALQTINLDGNLIGEAGAAMMLTTIQAKPEIFSLCVTKFISRTLMVQLTEQLSANWKLQKAKGKKSHRKKSAK